MSLKRFERKTLGGLFIPVMSGLLSSGSIDTVAFQSPAKIKEHS
jgi:hypothetical protein